MRQDARSTAPRIAWFALLRSILLAFLAIQAAKLALYLARWPEPVKYFSLAILLVMIWLAWQGLRSLYQWGRTLTLKRIALGFLTIVAATVFFFGINNPTSEGPVDSFRNAAVTLPHTAQRWVVDSFWHVVGFPGEMWVAYTGKSLYGLAEGDDSASSVIVNEADLSPITIPVTLPVDQGFQAELGDRLTTSSQAISLCKMAALSDEKPFTQGTRVSLIEGPRFLDGQQWWRVQSDQAIGWCPGSAFLMPE